MTTDQTQKDLENRIRADAPLIDRLDKSLNMLREMCKYPRPPKMSIPVQWYDEDLYIATTCIDAANEIEHLRAENERLRRVLETTRSDLKFLLSSAMNSQKRSIGSPHNTYSVQLCVNRVDGIYNTHFLMTKYSMEDK